MRHLFTLLIALVAVTTADAQSRYFMTLSDLMSGNGIQLDTLFTDHHSKSRQLWWGGNDYVLTTGDARVDKTLKKNAFAVMQADTLYVNCRNLRYQKTGFGNGYTRAMRIGEHSVLFVNKMIGRAARNSVAFTSVMFGGIAGTIAASQYNKQQVCYLISWGADDKGHINIRLLDDDLIEQMLKEHPDLWLEYRAEQDDSKRILAKRVVPLLEKAGLFNNKPKQ